MKVNDTWMRIKRALSVDVPVAEIKKKKDSLMASFRHHLRRKKASIKSGASSDEVYKPTWYAYEVMEGFLGSLYDCDPTYNTENSVSNLLKYYLFHFQILHMLWYVMFIY
jgi:hypothetical protein